MFRALMTKRARIGTTDVPCSVSIRRAELDFSPIVNPRVTPETECNLTVPLDTTVSTGNQINGIYNRDGTRYIKNQAPLHIKTIEQFPNYLRLHVTQQGRRTS